MLERGQRVGGFARLRDRDDQRARVRHAVAVAVFAGNFDRHGDLGDRFDPVLGGQAGVVAGAAGQDQQRVDVLEDLVGVVAEQLGRDGLDVLQRVADGARLLEDFLLHVVAVGAEFSRAGVHLHGMHLAFHILAVGVHDPDARQLQVDDVAVFQVDDLVGGAGQRQRVRGQEVLVLAHPHHQRRTLARADHAVRFVTAEHGDGVGAMQAAHGVLHGLEQVAGIQVVDQVRDHFGVGLAFEDVAHGLQLGAQFVVVLDDAVVHQRDARLVIAQVREMRVGIMRGRHAVRGPAGVGDAGETLHLVLRDLFGQLGHALGAARAAQVAVGVDGDAAGVIAAVFQPLQAFDQDRGDVALGDGANNAAHRRDS
ncbi:Uncharacterised protein [Achromobacter xylosoxidans]|nr:Uncharacterised protein [Achromobacter xylosoxidans]